MKYKLKSKYLRDFINKIKYVNRNPQDIKALELIDDINTNPEINIKSGSNLYRCRIVTDKSKINKEKNFYGYNAKESFTPPANLTKDMRANYRYIPYLYCANNPYISLVEVRPRFGAIVSVATIITTENIRLLDFTLQETPNKMSVAKKIYLRIYLYYSLHL